MFRRAYGLWSVAVFLLATTAVARAGVTIHVSEVDAGQGFSAVEVSLPWGDYVGIDEGGGVYWVGTYQEYEHARVVGISKDLGFRESSVKYGGDTTFVEQSTLRAHVGDAPLDGITPSVDFESRADIPTSRVLNITWLNGGGHSVTCFLYVPSDHRSYLPDPRMSDASGGYRNEEIDVPKRDLAKPVLLVFVQRGQKPAILAIHSIAKLDYAISYQSWEGLTLDSQQALHLKYLRMLDHTIRPPAAATPMPTPATPITSYMNLDGRYSFKVGDYPWTCGIDPNNHKEVVVNRGDMFRLNAQPRATDTTYSITVRPSIYVQDGYNAVCTDVDAKTLNRMAGINPKGL